MKFYSRIASGAGVLSVSEAVVQLCTLLRNIVIVRALTQTEYGIAATFTLVVAMIDSAGNMKVGGLLIAAKDGDEPRFQETVQFFRFVQGCIQAAFIYALAPIFCAFFNIPQAESHYRILALIPLIRAASHSDTDRVQRDLRYVPMAAANGISQVLTLIATVVLAQSIQGYTLVLYAVTLRPLLFSIITHMTAERSYRWAFDRGYMRRMMSFGWPLIVNGLFMLVVSQGDRFLIGSAESLPRMLESIGISWDDMRVYDKKDLAVYSIAVTISVIPTLFISKIIPPVLLPLFSRSGGRSVDLARSFGLVQEMLVPIAVGVAVFFILLGSPATILLYSDRYASVGGLVGILGIAAAVRVLRMGQTVAALSQAETRIVLHGNVSRSVALFGFAAVIAFGKPLEWIALTLIGGEVFSLGVVAFELRRRCRIPVWATARALLFVAPAALGAQAIVSLGLVVNDFQAVVIAGLYMVLVGFAALASFPDLRARTIEILNQRRAAQGGPA